MSSLYIRYPAASGSSSGVTSINTLTGAVTLAAGTGISITPSGNTLTIAATGSGSLSLAAFGSVPNANGASLAANVLTLQPADGTHPGGVSIAAQTFGGTKTFANQILLPDGTTSLPAIGFTSQAAFGINYVGLNSLQLFATDTVQFDIFNNGTNDDSILKLSNNGSSTGDQFIWFLEAGVTGSQWAIGRDDSDSGTFKVSQSATLGTNDFLKIATTGAVTLGATGVTNTFTGAFTAADAKTTELSFVLSNTDNTTGTSNSALKIRTGGSSGGDPYIQFRVTGGADWSLGTDNSDSDSFVLTNASSLSGTNIIKATTGNALSLGLSGGQLGFFGATPASQSATYTITNVTTDRSYDANSTTIDELADVLGTLIADLKALGLIG